MSNDCDIFLVWVFDAPGNYNLSDFYIQTLAIVPHDREASLERVEVISSYSYKNLFYLMYIYVIVHLRSI